MLSHTRIFTLVREVRGANVRRFSETSTWGRVGARHRGHSRFVQRRRAGGGRATPRTRHNIERLRSPSAPWWRRGPTTPRPQAFEVIRLRSRLLFYITPHDNNNNITVSLPTCYLASLTTNDFREF